VYQYQNMSRATERQTNNRTNPRTQTMITQAQLREFAELTRRISEWKQRRDELRVSFLGLHDNRALTEPGEFALTVEERQARQFSKAKLIALLGETEVQSLLNRIEPTSVRIVKVT
jgi:hypothetical protein